VLHRDVEEIEHVTLVGAGAFEEDQVAKAPDELYNLPPQAV
jgi:hypothetical protein